MTCMNASILRLALMTLIAAPAWADDAAESCHQMAISGQADPLSFTQMCSNKTDLAKVCDDQVRKMGPESSENYLIRYFIVPNAPCKDTQSVKSFCAFVRSFDGYQTLGADAALVPDPSDPDFANLTHPRARAATVCGTTPEAIHATLCQTADASKQWDFAIAECPIEGRLIFIRECVKPRTTVGEGGGQVVVRTATDCANDFDSRKRR